MEKKLTKKKTPFAEGVVESTVTSTSRVANFSIGGKPSAGGTPTPAGGVFLSLSKGTLKSSSGTLYDSASPGTLLTTMTKEYPNRVKFFRFKQAKRLGQRLETNNTVVRSVSEPTEEQKRLSHDRSLARTRREIADIVDCNDFDKFATFTFDPKKHPQCNEYEYAKKKMILWLNNQQKLHGAFRYILVPEPQKSGNVHFHALLGGFTGKYHRTNTRGSGENERQCYKIDSWENSNGFADMEDIGNKEATGRYIGKYIVKQMHSSPYKVEGENLGADESSGVQGTHLLMGKGGKRYFSSKGLNRPAKKYNQELSDLFADGKIDPTSADGYENDFVEVTTLQKR